MSSTILKRVSNLEIPSVVSFIGSIASAEVLKLVSCKYTPISQWFTWEDHSIVRRPNKIGNNYLGKLLGLEFEKKLSELKISMVGCGAIGCEWLKILSQMH